jgi:hypothetical protein
MKAKIIGGAVALAGTVLVVLAIWVQAYILEGHQIFSFYFHRPRAVVAAILFTTSLRFFVPAFYKESTLLRFGLLVIIALGSLMFGAVQAILFSISALLGWIFVAYGIRQAVHGIPMVRKESRTRR